MGEPVRTLTHADLALIKGNPQLELLSERWELARNSGVLRDEIEAWQNLMTSIRYAGRQDVDREVGAWAGAFGVIV